MCLWWLQVCPSPPATVVPRQCRATVVPQGSPATAARRRCPATASTVPPSPPCPRPAPSPPTPTSPHPRPHPSLRRDAQPLPHMTGDTHIKGDALVTQAKPSIWGWAGPGRFPCPSPRHPLHPHMDSSGRWWIHHCSEIFNSTQLLHIVTRQSLNRWKIYNTDLEFVNLEYTNTTWRGVV